MIQRSAAITVIVETADEETMPSSGTIEHRLGFILSNSNMAEKGCEGYYSLLAPKVTLTSSAAQPHGTEESTATALREKYDAGDRWGEHPRFPMDLWREGVAATEIRAGYWDWVASRLEEGRRR